MQKHFYLFLLLLSAGNSFSQNWQPLGAGIDPNGTVKALCVYQGELYAGGSFSTAGGVACANIARWNGTTWQPCAAGTNNEVRALCVYNGELYVGGSFTSPFSYLIKWNGTAWSDAGAAITTTSSSNAVNALDSFNNRLFIGGNFNTTATFTPFNVMQYDGTNFSACAAGLNQEVYAFAQSDTSLYAGGLFNNSGPTQLHAIARWTGTVWTNVGVGFTAGIVAPKVFGMADYKNNLCVGGQFSYSGSTFVNEDARWDTTWNAMGTGTNNLIYCMLPYDTVLVIGGLFSTAGGVSCNKITAWNGSGYQQLSSGMSGTGVYALCLYNNELIAGGDFNMAGGITAENIAKWSDSTTSIKNISGDELNIFPNPAGEFFVLRCSFCGTDDAQLLVRDLSGRLVKQQIINHQSTIINSSSLLPGIYFYEVEMNGKVWRGKMVKE